MSTPLRLSIGAGGALLAASLFMPWAPGASGWELLATADVFLLIVALVAFAAAITGGRIGLFRPDVSLIAATDLFGVAATVVLACLATFDFPSDAGREAGVFLALAASAAIATAAGNYRDRRGVPLFPRLDG